ncbi:ribosome biogenesis protein Noc4 [Obba rivulosa]|uniref:Ribosome biogenesis protein Noc4 n=1 Tax=Obba rivulosa TaxID=1052685 RepID=A0A8E2DHD5_9APHY|nr:ribosome biogenesis protein Noc4 [Obba rivulosa]
MATRSLPPTSKKRKITSADDALASIAQLEGQLASAISANASLNPLVDLLDLAYASQDPPHMTKAIYALYRSFVLIIANGIFFGQTDAGNSKAVRSWLSERMNRYVELLSGLLKDNEPMLRTSALEILLSLQKHLSLALNKRDRGQAEGFDPQFHSNHFRKIVLALLTSPASARSHSSSNKKAKTANISVEGNQIDPSVRDTFTKSYLNVYDDVRWFFLRDAANILAQDSSEPRSHVATNLLSILEGLSSFPSAESDLNSWWVEDLRTKPSRSTARANNGAEEDGEEVENGPEGEDDWRKFFEETPASQVDDKKKVPSARLHTLTIHESLHSLASHKAVFTHAWLSLLPRISSGSAQSTRANALRALNILHRGVLPHLTRPVLAMDWIGSCVDYGGTVGLLALNALFTLMTQYNLDYPSFYTRLYAFLDRDVLHLKHRARFFRLTDLFLSSTHLPAALVASFVKRLSRLSLNAPPAAIIMIVPFVYNMLKQHPALMPMIHRSDDVDAGGVDPFLPQETNPNLTRAVDSSLWELYTHRQHYHATVSTLTRVLEEAFTRPNYAMEDFLDHTYGTLYDTEARRKMRSAPAFVTDIPGQ